jgi:hypothetical protein
MHCHYHEERPVERECRLCHHLVCADCVVEIGEDAVCKTCLASKVTLGQLGIAEPASALNRPQPKESQNEKAVKLVKKKRDGLQEGYKSGFLTVLFSMLPGLGHLYLGLQKRGLSMLILYVVAMFFTSIIPDGIMFPVVLAIIVLWFYSQFDALKYRTLINAGETFDDEPMFPQYGHLLNMVSVGYLLAIIGGISIIYNMIDMVVPNYMSRSLVKEFLSALILIGIGVFIMKGKADIFFKRRESEEERHA